MDICLFGPQGSGKGTQGKLLASQYNLVPFVMGDQLRATVASGSALGQTIKSVIDRGDLVTDEIIMQMVEAFLSKLPQDQAVLFDGIPRTMHQSNALIELLKTHQREAFGILIHISNKEAIQRLTRRRMCSNCKEIYPAFYKGDACQKCQSPLVTRQDDSNLESIQKRLENYKNSTLPVVDNFKERDRLIIVDGEQSIDEVSNEMIEKIGYLFT